MKHVSSAALMLSLVVTTMGCSGNTRAPSGSNANSPLSGNTYGSEDPGSKSIQRLDRVEYNNTVHDLLGTAQTPADGFPVDETYMNFDNIGAVLGMSPALLQPLVAAATSLGDEVISDAADPNLRTTAFLKIAPCAASSDTLACINAVAKNFGMKAWRRPLTTGEAEALVRQATSASSDFPTQVGVVVASLLSSPYFLYRVELDPTPDASAPHGLSAFELATRLSYFIWRSTPDDALLQSALSGALLQDTELKAQTERLLADPRAQSLVSSFASNWLLINQMATVTPDPNMYPTFNDQVRASMLAETSAFLSAIVLGSAPLTDLLTADYTYADNTMATWYGLPSPKSSKPIKVQLPDSSRRMGVLSQGTLLVTGSSGISTSPILRGKLVLSQLMCSSPPAPPPNVALLSQDANTSGTMRQRLAQHVADPSCAACHIVMDDIGFAFEDFDGVGTQRTMDNGLPIDTSGTYNSQPFASNLDLSPLMAADPRFMSCTANNLLTYGLGRATQTYDKLPLQGMSSDLSADGQIHTLIQNIVLSASFRSRRGLGTDAP